MFKHFLTYLRESREELQKVTWPTKKQVFQYTMLVIAISIAVALFLGGLDYLFGWLLKAFVL